MRLLLRAGDRRVDAHALALPSRVLEPHAAVHECEQRVVAADADVHAGFERRPALAHEDAAGADELAVANLDAEPLSGTVPPIAGAAHPFLMSHGGSPLFSGATY